MREDWIISDDCANWLNPSDLIEGRHELKLRMARLTTWLALRRKQSIQLASSLAATAVALSVTSGYVYPGLSFWAVPVAAVLGMVAVGFWQWPSLSQRVGIDWRQRAPFIDPALDPLYAYLAQLRKSRRRVSPFGKDSSIDVAILENPWALLYLSDDDWHYKFPICIGVRIEIARYPQGISVESPGHVPVDNREPEPAPIVYVDQRSVSTLVQIDLAFTETTYVQFITAIRAAGSAAPGVRGSSAKPVKVRPLPWPCAFEGYDYEIRLKVFASETFKTLALIQPHQLKKYLVAIDSARRIALADPSQTRTKLIESVGKVVANNTDGCTGLDKSNSTAWIKALLNESIPYGDVAKAMRAIQYNPREHDPDQYRMLS